jgi:hypothetical protein
LCFTSIQPPAKKEKMTRFEMKMPPLPEVPSKVQLYKTTKISEENKKKQVESLANSLGLKKGLKGLSDTPEGSSVKEGHHVLETYKESDSIWYGDMSKLWNETTEPMDLKKALGAKSAVEVEKAGGDRAKDFLKKNGLLPNEAYLIGVEKTEIAELKPGEKKVGETMVTGAQINFGFKLDNIPVVGPGAKISVNFGSDGEVVGLFKAWRGVEKGRNISTVTPKDALEKFKNSKVFAELDEQSKVNIKKFYLGYYALPAFEPQDYLLPMYIFEGETETPYLTTSFVHFIPAISIEELKNAGIMVDLGAFPLLP